MSVLLRHPATVPALFSRAVDPDARAQRGPSPWRRVGPSVTLLWVAVMLIEVPLVQAATAAVGLAPPY